MKKLFFTLMGIAAVAAVACQPKEEAAIIPGRMVDLNLTAGLPETRTYIEAAEGGWQPYWSPGDSIAVTLSSDYSKQWSFRSSNAEGAKTGSFAGKIEAEKDGEYEIVAFRPRRTGRAETIYKFDITNQQIPSPGTFDPTKDILIADPVTVNVAGQRVASEAKVHFKRILSVIRILVGDASSGSKLAGKAISEVKLTSSSEVLSGSLRVDVATGKIDKWESSSQFNYVTATCPGDGWTVGSSVGGMVLTAPVTLPSGSSLKLEISTADGAAFARQVQLPEAISLEAGKVYTFRFNFTDADLESEVASLKPVTETTSWASTFTKGISEFGAGTEVKTDFILDNLGFVAGGSKFKFGSDAGDDRVQLGGTGAAGTKACIQFMAAGNGKLSLKARSSGDAARPVVVAVGKTEAGRGDAPAKTAAIASFDFDITASGGELVNIFSANSAINIYDVKWEPSGSGQPGDEPGQGGEEPSGENAELEIPSGLKPAEGTVEPGTMYGFAQAAGVTGGEGASAANTLHFDNGKALQTWLLARSKSEKKGDHSPVVIWLSGTFGPGDGRDFSEAHPWFDVKEVSNLSFYGTDGFVMDRIGIFCVRSSNIIIRNINFRQPKANNGADAVSMQECEGVWVDHCSFTSLNQTKDYEDGSTDITHGSKNVTVSWCRYIKTQKSCLVGHSNNETGDSQITATFHHNWFDGSSSRHPRVRFGTAHVYNNLFDGCTTYGVGSAYGAKVLVEYNYFDAVQLPTDICTYPAKESGESNLQGKVAGYLYAAEDILANRPAKAKDPYPLTNVKYTSYNGSTVSPLGYADFKPAYDYIVTPAAEVPDVVKANAGYGKLGWDSAPVAVNNGGISEYSGSDDNPTDPDTGDEDDPDTPAPGPGDGGARTHVLYYNSGGALQNLTDGASGSYFTASASANLGGDYAISDWSINGYSSSKGVKMNSTGSVSFTTSTGVTSTVQFWFVRRKSGQTSARIQIVPSGGTPQVFGSPYDEIGDSGVLSLEKGVTYTIKQDNSEQALLLVIVEETE